ncbi:MAG: diguanylate cyclase [Woeseiaceae bacterium]|nr:diguanylate cyclase [Woeseiaceae bacterium]
MSLDIVLAVLLGICASFYIRLAIRVLRGDNTVRSPATGLTFLVLGLWVLGGAIEQVAVTLEVFRIGRFLHFVGNSLVPVGILVSFREITGNSTPNKVIGALLVIPFLSILFAATNHLHQWMWLYPTTNIDGEFLVRPLAWGPWFLYVHAPFAYLVVSAALLTLLLHSSAVAPTHRRGLFLIVGTAMAPIITVVAYDFGVGPNTLSIVPLVLAWMLPIYAWLLLNDQVIEFNPVAYETVFQNMQDPVIVVDEQERVIGMNHGAERLLNLSESQAIKSSLDGVFGEEVPEVHAALDTGVPQKMLTYTGRFLHLQVTPIATGQKGSKKGRVLMFRDVSDVENAQREVQNSEKLLRTLIDHSVNGIVRMSWISADDSYENRELRCIFANAAAGRILQTNPDQIIHCTAKNMMALFTVSLDDEDAEVFYDRFLEAAQDGEVFDTEIKIERKGTSHWIRVISEPVGEDVAVTFVDVTDARAEVQQMESIAHCDPLTGVLNRRGFETNASRLLTESDDDASGALLFIDLNDFKKINDEYGHEIGDQLLVIAAERIKSSFRSHDIIGRPGGDEFVVLVPDVPGDVAERLAQRLSAALDEPYHIEDLEHDCAAAIGLALYPEHANTLTGLLRAADQAMYRAKARCRGARDIDASDLLEKAI